jgi:carboxymethylenebutenolidase
MLAAPQEGAAAGAVTLGRSGSDFEFSCGSRSVAAYRAAPPGGWGRGLLVLGDAPGLADFEREVCERAARTGFVALAPGLPAASGGGFDAEAAPAVLDGALDELLNCDATDAAQLGVMAFGAGAAQGLQTAARNRRVAAVVVCDGALDTDALDGAELPDIHAPLLWILGAEDDALESGAAADVEARLAESGVSVRLCIQRGAGRGFLDEARADVFDAEAAAEAWDLALAFLRAKL